MQTTLTILSSTLQTVRQKMLAYSKLWLFASLSLLLFTGSLNQVQAAISFRTSNYVIIGGTNTNANGRYYTNNPNASANKGSFASIMLGSFDRGTGSLTLNAEVNTAQNANNDNVQFVQLFYRVYEAGTTAPTTFTALNLDNRTNSGSGGNQTSVWTASVTPPNLLTATSGGGTNTAKVYRLDLYIQARSVGNQGIITNLFDGTSLAPYTTTFSVTGTPAATWTGATSTNWFTGSNWSGGTAPTSTTDVTITLQSSVTNYPTISGVNNVAKVRTLRIDNSINTSVKILTLTSGELQVYGDFQNPNNGFNQRNGTFTLAGTTQTFDGGSFTDFRVQGGGTKTLTNRMDITNFLTFYGAAGIVTGGILATRTDNSVVYNIDLGTTAQVVGESEESFVLGILRAPYRVITRSAIPYTFGGIGIELIASLNSPADPGSSVVTRRTGLVYTGVGTKNVSIARSFTFSELDNSDPQIYTLSFRYLNIELNGLDASKLGFYRSATGGSPFDDLNRAGSNPSTRTVVSGIITGNLAATFTLGETILAPLPVTLVSFTAAPTAQGGALLRWATASETNNKGFGIERQLVSGGAWQSVGYLNSGNNALGGTYTYTDKSLATAMATPQAYYRLRQEDLDGKLTYSPVAVISRAAVIASTDLVLSPVPVTGSSISLTFAEAAQAGSEIAITSTSGQRMLSYTTQASQAEELSLPVANLAPGVYIVSVRVVGQPTRYARFIKM